MIRNLATFVCAMLLLAGCGNKLPEQYVLVEWGTSGKDIVVNNLDESISFKIHFEYFDFGKDSVVVIKSKESASYDRSTSRPMVSVSEASEVTIHLVDSNKDVVCVRSAQMSPWANYFFTNTSVRTYRVYEHLKQPDTTVPHDMADVTYTVDDHLIELYSQE
ncbi:MAG: hypothetical protein IKO31_07420 [Bacteroidales bacterium]|nr:hypothetical protein [Bacteroidales bacterium]